MDSKKIKNEEEIKDTAALGKNATVEDGHKLDIDKMMTADNKIHEEVANKEKSDIFDAEEGKLGEGSAISSTFFESVTVMATASLK